MSSSTTRIAAALARRFGSALEPSPDLPNLDALAALNERSVCRRYRPDPVPEAVRRRRDLIERDRALRGIHAPETMTDVARARRRLGPDGLHLVGWRARGGVYVCLSQTEVREGALFALAAAGRDAAG